MAKREQRVNILDEEAFEAPLNTKYLQRLMRYLIPYKKQAILSIVVMIIAAAAGLASPMIIKIGLDNYIEKSDFSGLPWLSGAVLLASIISAVGQRYKVRLMNVSGRKAIANLRQDLFDHIQTLSFDFFDNRSAGKIMVRVINDVNALLNLFTNGVVNSLTNVILLFFVAGVMLWLDWKLALVAFSTLPFLLVLVFVLKPFIKRLWRVVRWKSSNLNAYLHESLSGIRVTQAYVREDKNAELFRQINTDAKSTWMRAIKVQNTFWPAFELISVAGTCMIYFFGVRWLYSGADHAVTLGTLISMTWYLGRFWDPLNQLSNLYTQLLVAMASLERIFEIMDISPTISSKKGAIELPPIEGRVDFQDVVFGYDSQQVVLDHVSFSVKAGETIALVGPTGAGKSTVVNLITRFYDTRTGSVKIDGYDVKDVDLTSLRKQMGIMQQDTFIFSGTIMDNIRYGRLDATDEEVMEACKAVHAHDFIMRTEKGYYTEVQERGSRLSMGQRQLISFARALLADPRILILDEATASIDTHTEILIQQALDTLLKGRTSFVVAHRLSTIRKADCIMVVADGKIMEAGNHDELMRQQGMYYDLCQAQYRFLEVGS